MSLGRITLGSLAFVASLCAGQAHALQRAFVASDGTDSNVAQGCGLPTPCRSFAAALGVVDSGGEIVALDAAGYGAVVINKSVSIVANPGFYAGISVTTGTGVSIVASGVKVVLRGLNLNGVGGTTGMSIALSSSLTIENCIVSGFTANGVFAGNRAVLRVLDSVIRNNNGNGIEVAGAAVADIVNTKLLGNSDAGLRVTGNMAGPSSTTNVTASESLAVANNYGFIASGELSGGSAELQVIRSSATNNGQGGFTSASTVAGATAIVVVSESMSSRNGFGLQVIQTAGTATLETLGNNAVRQNNAANSIGTITPVSTQ